MKGDFWEYKNSQVDAYWTGYFSTNPQLKKEVVEFSDLVETYQLMTNFGSFISGGTGFMKDTQNYLIETLSIM